MKPKMMLVAVALMAGTSAFAVAQTVQEYPLSKSSAAILKDAQSMPVPPTVQPATGVAGVPAIAEKTFWPASQGQFLVSERAFVREFGEPNPKKQSPELIGVLVQPQWDGPAAYYKIVFGFFVSETNEIWNIVRCDAVSARFPKDQSLSIKKLSEATHQSVNRVSAKIREDRSLEDIFEQAEIQVRNDPGNLGRSISGLRPIQATMFLDQKQGLMWKVQIGRDFSDGTSDECTTIFSADSHVNPSGAK